MGLLLTLIVGLFILVGTIIGRLLKNNKTVIDFSISMAFGVIISLSILELFPEIIESVVQVNVIRGFIFAVLSGILGFILLYQLDALIPHHEMEDNHHHHKHSSCLNEHLRHIGIVTSIALILHNLIEGMSIYITTNTELKTGLLLCIGVGLHNLPMGLMIESTLHNEYKFSKIFIISLVVSLATLVGGIIVYFLSTSELLMGLLLSITLGMLIYISIIELLPQVTNIKNKNVKYIGVLTGVAILVVSLIFG